MSQKIRQINLKSSHYPPLLAQIPDPPKVLYAIGNISLLQNLNAIAVVGTRKATAYGLNVTREICSSLAKNGLMIVSGLARGIDASAHKAALDSQGYTIAVMGLGLDKIYPLEHKQLAKEIVDHNGLLISEYPMGKPGLKYQFAHRNRIIAGLSRATLVVEAPKDSGALITASLAIDYNRDVFAVPGDITRPTSYGSNKLISMGARAVLGPQEILQEFNILPLPNNKKTLEDKNLNYEQKQILKVLAENGALTLSQLAENCPMPIEIISQNLTLLELEDKISVHLNGTYALKSLN